MIKSLMLIIPFAALLAMASCSKTSTPGPNTVYIENMAFTPSSITVPVNTTITWTNKDAVTHNVTSDSGWFASGNIVTGASYTRQFTTVGHFTYSCTIHPYMKGSVTVQ